MSEYLDKTGLSYFWGKVKEKLNNKANDVPVTKDGTDSVQTWNVFPSYTMNLYGANEYYTLLLEKD